MSSSSVTAPLPIPTTETLSSNGAQNPSETVPDELSMYQPWRDEFTRVNSSLAEFNTAMRFAVKQNTGAPILRVNQLDAIILDNELYDMLRMQFLKVFIFFRGDFVERWKPELEAALKTLIFEISIGRRNFSYGQQLQNLTFTGLTRSKKILFVILSVFVPYLLQRWFVLYQFWLQKIRGEEPPENPQPATLRRIHTLEKLYQLCNTINFLFFLWNGDYVSIVHRVLGIKQNYLKRQMARHIGFEYMNRQLIWNGFTEFMLFIMPMIPVNRIARTTKWLGSSVLRLFRLSSSPTSQSQLPSQNDNICPICNSSISIPYQTNCGHVYCYYCLKVATMSESKPPCNVCGSYITSIQRCQPS